MAVVRRLNGCCFCFGTMRFCINGEAGGVSLIIARLSSKGLKHATNSLRMISLVNIRLGRKLQKQISKVSLMEMLPLMYWNNVLIW